MRGKDKGRLFAGSFLYAAHSPAFAAAVQFFPQMIACLWMVR
jgi:hypothetical protein